MSEPFVMHGEVVTEEQIQAWADEAEAGYDPPQLRRPGRPRVGSGPTGHLNVREEQDIIDELKAIAATVEMTPSALARVAVRQYLTQFHAAQEQDRAAAFLSDTLSAALPQRH